MAESAIFPKMLPPSAKVEKFVYRHEDLMDPSDAAVLVYTCSKEDYEKELARLTAIGTEPEACRFIYVENTHCNYFSDIRYPWYIGKKYLPFGYDAMPGNPVREAIETNKR